MKKILIIIILFPLISFCQRGGGKSDYSGDFSQFGSKKKSDYFRGSISGKIVDAKNNKELEFANVSITNTKWNKEIEGTITNQNGKFLMSGILTGEYILKINYLGYKSKEIEFNITKKSPDVRLKEIKLEAISEMLSEVTIIEEKPIYESKLDKIIYNAENDDNGANEDATDVLRKAPLLSVDFDGNVELRGSKNIKFLLNGRASSFLSGDLASALQMIPADEIKSVEIITSPGSKYDGEGEAGIVNIVTQKKIIDGYKASVDGSFGSRNNKNGFNLTLGKGRFSLSARGNAWYSWPRDGSTTYRREDWNENRDTINVLTNNGTSRSQWIGYGAGINMYYDINAYNSISSDINFRGRNFPSENRTTIKYKEVLQVGTGDTANINEIDIYQYDSYLESTNTTKNISWNTDFTRNFEDNEDRELSISYQLGNRIKDNTSDITSDTSLINTNKENNFEHTLQIDYSHPIFSHILEFGSKMIIRNQKMDYKTDSDIDEIVFPNEIFNYTQRVNAYYISTNIQLENDYSILAGTRYELTNINGNWEKNNEKSFTPKEYGNLLPNLTISKKLGAGKNIKLSYNSRISRPNSSYINTNTNISDRKNITIGNPNLTPATTKQVEFGYNNFGRKYQGSYYLYFKQNDDLIESILSVENDISTTTYENIGSSTTYGINYYGSIKFEKLTLRSGVNLYKYNAKDSEFASEDRSALLYSYNFGVSLKMRNNWKAEGFGFMRSPSQTLQGSSTSFSMMSFGIKKEFNNKRGSIGIRIIEPFAKNGEKIWTTELSGDNFYQISERTTAFTSIGISFKYTFGKLNFKTRNKRSKINNDDVKEDSNNEM